MNRKEAFDETMFNARLDKVDAIVGEAYIAKYGEDDDGQVYTAFRGLALQPLIIPPEAGYGNTRARIFKILGWMDEAALEDAENE